MRKYKPTIGIASSLYANDEKLYVKSSPCRNWPKNKAPIEIGAKVIYTSLFNMIIFEVQTYNTFLLAAFLCMSMTGFCMWTATFLPENAVTGVLSPPMVGSFENNIGHFFAKDTYNGKNVLVVFRWDARNKERPIWGQAFSPDNGKIWEWNWYNVSERVK